MPVLLLCGDKSPELFIKVVDTLHSLLPNAKRYQLPNSFHGQQLENPEVFYCMVLDFINKHWPCVYFSGTKNKDDEIFKKYSNSYMPFFVFIRL